MYSLMLLAFCTCYVNVMFQTCLTFALLITDRHQHHKCYDRWGVRTVCCTIWGPTCTQSILSSKNCGKRRSGDSEVCSHAASKRQQRRTPANTDTEGFGIFGNKHAVKTTRQFEMGWLHFDRGTYHQIKTRNGGGTRHLSIQKSVTTVWVNCWRRARACVFPNGYSSKGLVEDFEFDIRDYSHNKVSPEVTVTQLYEQTELRMRIYTTSNHQSIIGLQALRWEANEDNLSSATFLLSTTVDTEFILIDIKGEIWGRGVCIKTV